jgi:hypothetical protein
MVEEWDLDIDIWIDDLGDSSRATFGDLPNWAIIIDPTGKIDAKLEWAEPENLANALPAPNKKTSQLEPADQNFLRLTTLTTPQGKSTHSKHHRHVMLAHLAQTKPLHTDRNLWLRELAKDGPLRQKAWAEKMLRTPIKTSRSTQSSLPATNG